MNATTTSLGLDLSELFLLLFGALLVVGIRGEYAKGERWKKRIVIFQQMVVFGVAGELFADGGVFLFSKHLQTLNETELAQLRDSTAKAQLELGKTQGQVTIAQAKLDSVTTLLATVSHNSDPREVGEVVKRVLPTLVHLDDPIFRRQALTFVDQARAVSDDRDANQPKKPAPPSGGYVGREGAAADSKFETELREYRIQTSKILADRYGPQCKAVMQGFALRGFDVTVAEPRCTRVDPDPYNARWLLATIQQYASQLPDR
jgi:hypothetical protein